MQVIVEDIKRLMKPVPYETLSSFKRQKVLRNSTFYPELNIVLKDKVICLCLPIKNSTLSLKILEEFGLFEGI